MCSKGLPGGKGPAAGWPSPSSPKPSHRRLGIGSASRLQAKMAGQFASGCGGGRPLGFPLTASAIHLFLAVRRTAGDGAEVSVPKPMSGPVESPAAYRVGRRSWGARRIPARGFASPQRSRRRRPAMTDTNDSTRTSATRSATCARIPGRVSPQGRRGARLPGRVRRRADQGRLDGRADPGGVWRLGPRPHRGVRDHGGDQPRRRQLRRLPRPDVQHGHAGPARLRGAEAEVPAEDRLRRAAPAIDGRHRADHRHRHHQDQDHRGQEGRPLRRQRPEGLDLARAALRPDDPAGAHHAADRGQEEVGGHVDLHRRPAPGDRQRA